MARRLRTWLGALAAITAGVPAHAETPAGCVTVEVPGDDSAYFECLTRRLQKAARQARAGANPRDEVPGVTGDPVRLGSASTFASGQRLGGDLKGATTLPVRSPRPPAASPFGPSR